MDVTRRSWEYLVEGSYNDSAQAGWELVWVTQYYHFKRPSIATSKGRPTWQFRGEDAYNDPGQAQRVLNERGGEGWELVVRAGNYYFFKRVASQGRPTWEYLVEDAYNDPGQTQRVLNDLGAKGWEFIETDRSHYYLKRASIASTTNREAEENVRTPASRPSRREPITLEYNVYYRCNGERVMVSRCRKDSDQLGSRPRSLTRTTARSFILTGPSVAA